MKKIIAASSFIAVLLMSCSPKVAVTSEPMKTSESQLAQGKTIYESSCKRCHDLPNPTDHSAQDWVGIMNSMAPKAKLSSEQHQWVYDYIVSVKK